MIELKKIYKNNRSMFNGAFFSLFSFINRGFSFLLLLILANYIAPLEYGYLSLFTTVMMLLGYFMAFSSEGYYSVVFFKEGINACKKVFTNLLVTSLLMTSVFLIVLSLFGSSIALLADIPLKCLYFAVIIVFFNVFKNTNLEYYRINENVKSYGILSCSSVLLDFIVAIVLVRALNLGWEGRVYSLLLVGIIYGLYALVFFIRKGFITSIDKDLWRTMLLWGIPLIPHLATTFIRQGVDRYIINYFHSTTDVGIFSFALNLTTLITMVGFGFNQSNSVSIYKICGDKDMDVNSKNSLLLHQRVRYLILYTVSAISIVILSLLVLPYILPRYSASLQYLPILGLYGMLVCYYLVYTNYLFYFDKTKTLMYITFGSSIIHLVFSLLFTRFSLYYTCVIYCVSQFLVVFLVRREALRSLQDGLKCNVEK